MPSGIYKHKKHTQESKDKMSLSHAEVNGENNPNWKGGRTKDSYGYILIYKPEHPNCTKAGYVLEHRLIMEQHLDRYLTKIEVVHHKNEIRYDNRIENLRLFKNKTEHTKYHKKLRKLRKQKKE